MNQRVTLVQLGATREGDIPLCPLSKAARPHDYTTTRLGRAVYGGSMASQRCNFIERIVMRLLGPFLPPSLLRASV